MSSKRHLPTSNRAARQASGRRISTALWTAILTLAALAGEPPDPGAPGLTASERLEALIARSAAERSRLRSLEARFVQRKESELLLEPEESQGTVLYLAPDRVRWDYASPSPATVVVSGGEVLTWSPEGGVERLAGGRRTDRMLRLLGPGASLEELGEVFSMSVTFPESAGEPYRLELVPRSARLLRRIASVSLRLDPELFVPVYLRIVEAGGGVTELTFEDLAVGGEVPAHRFELGEAAGDPGAAFD